MKEQIVRVVHDFPTPATRNRSHTFAAVLVSLFLVGLCAPGCGSGSSAGPKTPGDPEALVGTSWQNPQSNVTYAFKEAGLVEVVAPDAPETLTGDYTVTKGMLSGNVGLQTLEGAWDGKSLTLKMPSWDGKAMVMKDTKLVKQ